jgi:hypothetical protein
MDVRPVHGEPDSSLAIDPDRHLPKSRRPK